MSALWTAAEAAAATGGVVRSDWQASGVSIDSRTLAPGDLFVALTAARDGHDFVADALARGAAAAMVAHRPDGVAEDAPLLVVRDVLAGLAALGAAGRARSRARVAAITGSVGKTSAKEMMVAALCGQGRVHAAEASHNNHWGVPLTLARLPRDADFAVVEIGMNAPGEIAPLARLARPHVALITAIGPAHLAAFADGQAGIAREKASIAEGLEPGGIAILPADSDWLGTLADAARAVDARIVTFGSARDAGLRANALRPGVGVCVVEAQLGATPILFKVASPGRHMAGNALGVLAAAQALGADPAQAALGLGRWVPPAGRGARLWVGLDPADPRIGFTLIDDAFNANPASMAAALTMLAGERPADGQGRIARGRRIAILGDMLELGPDAPALHAALARDPAMATVDRVHCAGPLMRHLWQALPAARRGRHAGDAQALCADAHRLVDAGDTVLVKGSKGSRIARVVDSFKTMGAVRPLTGEEPF
jgi:UDP-N-acetylmuramoyl-tripeptide--D-alanyl-D-alanine ligase